MSTHAAASERHVLSTVAIARVTAIAIVAVPLFIDPYGHDVFRKPKEVAFRAAALLVIALLRPAMVGSHRRELLSAPGRLTKVLPLLILIWTAIATLMSTNPVLSAFSLLTIGTSLVLYYASRTMVRNLGIVAFDLSLVPAVLNAVLATLQEYRVWQPLDPPEAAPHIATTGFLGNPNDVGTFLLVPGVAAAVATFSVSGTRRWMYLLAALTILVGLLASSTRTALGAYGVALVAFALMRSWRHSLIVISSLSAAALFALTVLPGYRSNLQVSYAALLGRQYDVLFSRRLPPILAAIEMTRDYPITGAGPGTFKWQYMPYRFTTEEKYPRELTFGPAVNYGEAHNDHVQIAAEVGLPGYALFVTSLALILAPLVRKPSPQMQEITSNCGRQDLENIVQALRGPFVVAVFIVCLAQFPLQLAAPRLMLIFYAALCTTCER